LSARTEFYERTQAKLQQIEAQSGFDTMAFGQSGKVILDWH
jgi:hypothetical protein